MTVWVMPAAEAVVAGAPHDVGIAPPVMDGLVVSGAAHVAVDAPHDPIDIPAVPGAAHVAVDAPHDPIDALEVPDAAHVAVDAPHDPIDTPAVPGAAQLAP